MNPLGASPRPWREGAQGLASLARSGGQGPSPSVRIRPAVRRGVSPAGPGGVRCGRPHGSGWRAAGGGGTGAGFRATPGLAGSKAAPGAPEPRSRGSDGTAQNGYQRTVSSPSRSDATRRRNSASALGLPGACWATQAQLAVSRAPRRTEHPSHSRTSQP